MAVLKKIKFGTGTATPIAQTIVTAASESVLSVAGKNTGLDDDANPSYAVELNIDNATLTKDTTNPEQAVLKVGTVPAAQVSVGEGAGIEATNAQAAFKELKDAIDATGGAAKSYKIVQVQSPASKNTLAEYKIQQKIGTDSWGDVSESDNVNIVIPKDRALIEAYLGASTDTIDATSGVITKNPVTDPQSLNFAYQLADGTYTLVKVDVSAFLTESEYGDGLQVSGGVVSVKKDTTSGKVRTAKGDTGLVDVLTVSSNGVKVDNIQAAIDYAVSEATTNLAISAEGDNYITAAVDANNNKKINVAADVTTLTATAGTPGSYNASTGAQETASTAGTLSGTANSLGDAADIAAKVKTYVDGAIAIEAARSDAKNKADIAALDATVGSQTVASGKHVAVEVVEADGVLTGLTVTENDIASAQALADEISRAQSAETAIDSAVGLTKAASGETRSFTPTTNYGGTGASAATSVMDNMQKIDTALKAVSDKANSIQYKVSGTELTFYGMTEHT